MTDKHSFELFHKISKHLNLAIMNTQLYFGDHPEVKSQIDQALSELSRLRSDLTIVLFENILIVNNIKITQKDPVIQKFTEHLQSNSIEGISFSPGISMKELTSFIANFASQKESIKWTGSAITLGKLSTKNQDSEDKGGPVNQGLVQPVEAQNILHLSKKDDPEYRASQIFSDLDRIEEVFRDMTDDKKKSQVKELAKSIHHFVKGFSYSIDPMEYLGAIKVYDEYTFVHVSNVFILTMCQAEILGFTGKLLYDIGVAAVLHDMGKLFIPNGIINKPGFLTDEERKIMQTHSLKGARFLMEIDGITKLASLSAMDHHIRYNGTGYPNIKRNWRPNLISQMISISDAFDAMRSHRPYQKSKPQELIIKILKEESGTAFNPFLVDSFITLLDDGTQGKNQGKDPNKKSR